MELAERLREFSAKAAARAPLLKTEEATKTALVMPFLREILGYDPNDPTEIVPEYTADYGVKQGEKVDFAIMRDERPVILIECKKFGEPLSGHASQLFRYFGVTDAQFGILTDGAIYRFFTDLDKPNRLDDGPFLEVNILEPDTILVEELQKFVKSEFDPDRIRETAGDLKYTTEIKRLLTNEWSDPSEEFVRYFAAKVYKGNKTKARMEQFAQTTKNAFQQFIRDAVRQRLTTALETEEEDAGATPSIVGDASMGQEKHSVGTEDNLVTTQDEIDGFYVVKAIVRDLVDVRRIAFRDAKSYSAVLLDNNNRKPICRLRFNRSQKYLGVFDKQKQETRIPIESVDDIFKHASDLRSVIESYESEGSDR